MVHVLDVEHALRSAWLRSKQQVARAARARGQTPAPVAAGTPCSPYAAVRLGQLGEQLLGGLDAALEHLRRPRACSPSSPPVATERARERVQLAQRAVLGGEQPLIAYWKRPGSHSGSSSPAATFAARERMNSRSDSRLR